MNFKEIVGSQVKSKLLDVPEYGIVEVRGVSVAVWNKAKNKSKADCPAEGTARVIVASCYDADGKKIFSESENDHDWLVLYCPSQVFQMLTDAVQEVNSQEKAKVEEEAKNSETAPASDSSSS